MNSTKSIVLFGCKSTTKLILNYLTQKKYTVFLVSITPEKGLSQQVADYTYLSPYCEENNVPYYLAKKYSLKSEDDLIFFKNQKFDLGFVAGWQRLIPDEILSTFSIGVFGMHGSSMDLPKGRGRSPMNWSIIEGRSVFYTNIFKYKPGADDGDVLDGFKFQISPVDTAETMHFKNVSAMKYLIEKNISRLLSGDYALTPQTNITPTYYPKRSESDSLIDWGFDIIKLDRFIRAVTLPFNGAYSFILNKKVTIYRAAIFDFQDFGFESAQAGEILEVFPNGKFLVKVFGGILLIHEFETLAKIKTGMRFHDSTESHKVFELNRWGYYDIE